MARKTFTLRRGGAETVLILSGQDGKTARTYDLAPHGAVPRGAARLVVYADGAQASAEGEAPGARAAPRTHPPTVIAPERLAQIRDLDESVLAMLRAGHGPLDTAQPERRPLAGLEDLDRVLDMTRPHVADPPTPLVDDFVDYILPPETEGRYLETVNGHERDKLLRFVEQTHTYYVRRADGTERPTNGSVTHLAHKYSEEFDKDGCIARMMAGRNWPRVDYSIAPVTVASVQDVKQFFSKDELRSTRLAWLDDAGAVLWSHDMDIGRLRTLVFNVAMRPMTSDEIKAAWRIKGMRAANRGTEAHMHVELFLNRDRCDTECAEFHSFVWFARNVMIPMGSVAYRTEWRVFCEVSNVAGSIDCVCALADGSLGIIDWKRSVKVRETVERKKFGRGPRPRMSPPMDHLPDCDVACYALQLSLYAHIITVHYGKEVTFLILAQIHPDDHFYTFVPNLALEASYTMAERRLENATVGSTEHDLASAALAEASETLYRGRKEWDSTVPVEGIDIDGWRGLGTSGGKRPCQRSFNEVFGGAPVEEDTKTRYDALFGT
jgi:hypothetical protein